MNKGQTIGYIRVSSKDQNPERQLEGYFDKKFIEYASGRNTEDRPKLAEMLDYVREGDLVISHSMDRLARNLKDLRAIVDKLISKGVKICFTKENLSFTGKDNPMSMFFLSVMGAFAEFEACLIRERQREGIEIAKKNGVYKRRREKNFPPLVIELIQEELKLGRSVKQISQNLTIPRTTLIDFLRSKGYIYGMPEPWTIFQ